MNSLTIPQALQLAHAHRQAGRDQEAADIYAAILQSHPRDPAALFWLAELSLKHDQFERSIDLFRQAIEVNPN